MRSTCSTSAPDASASCSTTRWRALPRRPATCSTCAGTARRWSRRSISTSSRSPGPAVPVLEGVQVVNGVAYLAWSRTGVLVYVQGTRANESAGAGEPRGAPSRRSTPPGTAVQLIRRCRPTAAGWRWASGSRAAALDIWIKQLDRGPFTRLTFGGHGPAAGLVAGRRQVAFIRDAERHQRVCRGRWTAARRDASARAARPAGPGGHLVARRTLARAPDRQRRAPARATSSACGPAAIPHRSRWWRASSPSCTRPSHPTGAGSRTPPTNRAPTRCTCGRSRPTTRRGAGRCPTVAGRSRAGRRTAESCTSWTGPAGRREDPRVEDGSRWPSPGRCSTPAVRPRHRSTSRTRCCRAGGASLPAAAGTGQRAVGGDAGGGGELVGRRAGKGGALRRCAGWRAP